MEKILASQRINKVLKKSRQKLEKELKVRLSEEKGFIVIDGKDAYAVYIARNILDAIELGFEEGSALMLLNDDCMFEKINLKDYARPSRIKTIRGRVIGREGKAKKVLQDLTDCSIVIHDNTIGIIGKTENVDLAVRAIKSLIRGSPHSTVYTFLERNQRVLKDTKRELKDIESELEEK